MKSLYTYAKKLMGHLAVCPSWDILFEVILLQCRCLVPWCYCLASCKFSRCSWSPLKDFHLNWKLFMLSGRKRYVIKRGRNLLLAKPLSLKSLKTAAVTCLWCCLTCELEFWQLAERLGFCLLLQGFVACDDRLSAFLPLLEHPGIIWESPGSAVGSACPFTFC